MDPIVIDAQSRIFQDIGSATLISDINIRLAHAGSNYGTMSILFDVILRYKTKIWMLDQDPTS